MKKIARSQLLVATIFVSLGSILSPAPHAIAMGAMLPTDNRLSPAPAATTVAPPDGFEALWIGKNSDAANWSLYARDALEAYGDNLLKGPSDVESFCPMYSHLGHQNQIEFWIQLLAGVAQYESDFNPVSYMVESTMGEDPITGSQVISAGLFQLSYQDTPNYKNLLPAGLCVFDYAADSKLSMKDIGRTINDPKNNITCAVGIMNFLAGRHGAVAFNSGNYWSTLMPRSKYGRVTQIQAITKKLSFCSN